MNRWTRSLAVLLTVALLGQVLWGESACASRGSTHDRSATHGPCTPRQAPTQHPCGPTGMPCQSAADCAGITVVTSTLSVVQIDASAATPAGAEPRQPALRAIVPESPPPRA